MFVTVLLSNCLFILPDDLLLDVVAPSVNDISDDQNFILRVIQNENFTFKASLGSKRVLFSYFIITEPTELKLS